MVFIDSLWEGDNCRNKCCCKLNVIIHNVLRICSKYIPFVVKLAVRYLSLQFVYIFDNHLRLDNTRGHSAHNAQIPFF